MSSLTRQTVAGPVPGAEDAEKNQNCTICALWSEQSGGMKGTNEQRYKCKTAARLQLPDFTNRNMGRPVQFEFQIKTTTFGCAAQLLHGTYLFV